MPNDVFLSHRIFKENYRQYVYLVHDQDSTYLLHNTKVDYQPFSDTVSHISGVLKPVPTAVDSTYFYESYVYLNSVFNRVDIYLTKNAHRKTELNDTIKIVDSDIQKAHLDELVNYPIKNRFRDVFKFVLLMFLSLLSLGFIIIVATWN